MLPAGSAPQNPLELMQSGKLSPLMEQLEAWFDWIVIDSPPVLPLADTSLWSRLADGILLVTRKGITEKQQLQRGLEAIEKSKLLGALVNSSANAAHSRLLSTVQLHLVSERPTQGIATGHLKQPTCSGPTLPRKSLVNQPVHLTLSTKQADRAEESVNVRRSGHHGLHLSPISEATPLGDRGILDAEDFRRMITLERKRSERSRKPFMLLLLDMGDDLPSEKNGRILGKILSALSASTRDTDVTGWYSNNCVVGVMFTEIAIEEGGSTPARSSPGSRRRCRSNLTLEQFNRVTLSFHVFPEDWDHEDPAGSEQSDPVPRPVAARRRQEGVPN